jgi:ribonuclease P protein component
MGATFPKSEKLCGEQVVDRLYKNGKRFVVLPLRITYLPIDQEPTQVLIWAPKALFKHAVDRNRLRRQMREAYRQNKQVIQETGKFFQIAFNYIDKEIQDYRLIEKAMRKALNRLVKKEEENEKVV